MCYLPTAAVLAALVLSPIAWGAEKFTITTKDGLALREGDKTYRVGMSGAEFEKSFGPPEIRDGKEGEPQSLYYTNDGVSVAVNAARKITNITVYTATRHEPPLPDLKPASVATDTGIRAGSSLREIQKAHGEPTRQDEIEGTGSTPTRKFYEYKTDAGRYRFTFVKGSLYSISLYR